MIASLHGIVESISPDSAVIECSGVGYLFRATPATLSRLRRGEEARVLTHLAVKEDAMTLYGFITDDERSLFLLLQTVNSVGPKLALACIGALRPDELASAISRSDSAMLTKIPGVGKRTADRMIVELKEKVAVFAPAESTGSVGASNLAAGSSALVEQVVEGLLGLGFHEKAARSVVEEIVSDDPEVSTSVALRSALVELGRGQA